MSLFNPFSRVRFGHSLHPSFTWACIQCSSALRHRPPSNGRQEGGRFPTPPPERAEYPFWQQYLLGVYSSELCTCQSAPICKTTEIHGLYFRNCLVLVFNLNWNLRIRQSWAVFFCSFWRVVLLHPTTKWFCLSFSNAMAESAMVRSTGALFICAQQGHSLEVPELHLQPITRLRMPPSASMACHCVFVVVQLTSSTPPGPSGGLGSRNRKFFLPCHFVSENYCFFKKKCNVHVERYLLYVFSQKTFLEYLPCLIIFVSN